MKKSLIAAAALFAAVAFTACNGSTSETNEGQDAEATTEIIEEGVAEINDTMEAPVDSVATDTIPAEA